MKKKILKRGMSGLLAVLMAFTALIGMSTTAFSGGPFGTTFEQGMQRGVRFFDFLGIKTLEEARALDAFYLRDKVAEFHAFFATTPDGMFQTSYATKKMLKGERWRMPLMITRTADEFRNPVKAENIEEFRAKIREAFGAHAEEFIAYCGDDLKTAMERSTTSNIEVATRTLAARNAELGITEPVYYAVFNPEIPGWDNPGTFHSSDLWFYFESLAKCWRPFKGKHYDLARLMCNYWANFVKCGDPNGKDADGEDMPIWKPYTDETPCRMIFGDTAYTEEKGPGELCEFLLKQDIKRRGLK